MSDYPKLAARVGDHYLAALAARQESFLKYIAAARTLAAPRVAMPMARTAIETTQQLNQAQFDFASRLLEQQKHFVDALLSQPARTGMPTAQRPAAKKRKVSSKKAAARKVTTKKSSAKRASAKKSARKATTKVSSEATETTSS